MTSIETPIQASEFKTPTAVIRLTEYYHPGIEHERVALYEVTRAYWSIEKDHRILDTEIVLAVHDEVVLEVYSVAAWVKANSTMMTQRLDPGAKGRYEFVGNIARETIRRRYIGRSIKGLIAHGNIRPVMCYGF